MPDEVLAGRETVEGGRIRRDDLEAHRGYCRGHAAIDLRLVEGTDLRPAAGPVGSIAHRAPILKHERVGQGVGADLGFVVVRDVPRGGVAEGIAVGILARSRIGGRVGRGGAGGESHGNGRKGRDEQGGGSHGLRGSGSVCRTNAGEVRL